MGSPKVEMTSQTPYSVSISAVTEYLPTKCGGTLDLDVLDLGFACCLVAWLGGDSGGFHFPPQADDA